MRKTIISLMVLLSGCASSEATVYGRVDQNDKTALIDAGNSGVLKIVKRELVANGWSLVVSSGNEILTGRTGSETYLVKETTVKARYRVIVDQRVYDSCFPAGDAIDYGISLVDNRTGKEVAIISGNGCVTDATRENLKKAISEL
jgi:hypothetical protein